jgi:hypothetical protein
MGKGGIIYPENFPPARFLRPARLMFFKKIFLTTRLFCPARLMFSKNFSTCTFISPYTSIRHTRVLRYFKVFIPILQGSLV